MVDDRTLPNANLDDVRAMRNVLCNRSPTSGTHLDKHRDQFTRGGRGRNYLSIFDCHPKASPLFQAGKSAFRLHRLPASPPTSRHTNEGSALVLQMTETTRGPHPGGPGLQVSLRTRLLDG